MRRLLIALAVASMVVVAGCATGPSGTDTPATTAPDGTTAPGDETTTPDGTTSSGNGTAAPGGSDDTVTPIGTVVTDTRPASDPAPDELPAGVDAAGVTNATALGQAHFGVLRGSSFRIDVSETGGTDPVSVSIHNGTGAVSLDITNASTGERAGIYIGNDTITRFNSSRSPPKVYSYGSTSEQFGALFVYAVLLRVYPSQQLTTGTFEVDGTVTRDGEKLIRLSATGVNETAVQQEGSSSGRGALADMAGKVWVRPDGLVRRMTLKQRYDSGATTSIEFAVSGIGNTSPAEPDWLGEAPRLEGSLSANGTVLELTNAGGVTVPANTTLSVQQGGLAPRLLGGVTLPEPVAPGESIYLYATGTPSEPTVEVALTEPSPADAVNLSRLSPQVSGTLGNVDFVIGVPENDSQGGDA